MTSPLDRIPPRLPRAPYEMSLPDRTLTVGGEALVEVRPVGKPRAEGSIEVALVCRAADDGTLLAEVTDTLDATGGQVLLTVPGGPTSAEGDDIVNVWTVVARAADGARRNLALPVPVWVGPADAAEDPVDEPVDELE